MYLGHFTNLDKSRGGWMSWPENKSKISFYIDKTVRNSVGYGCVSIKKLDLMFNIVFQCFKNAHHLNEGLY